MLINQRNMIGCVRAICCGANKNKTTKTFFVTNRCVLFVFQEVQEKRNFLKEVYRVFTIIKTEVLLRVGD